MLWDRLRVDTGAWRQARSELRRRRGTNLRGGSLVTLHCADPAGRGHLFRNAGDYPGPDGRRRRSLNLQKQSSSSHHLTIPALSSFHPRSGAQHGSRSPMKR